MLRVLSVALTGLTAAACQTTDNLPAEPDTQSVVLSESVSETKDLTEASKWVSTEKLWPEEPTLVHYNSQPDGNTASSQTLSFSCNTDTGAITGRLQNQPKNALSDATSYSIRTSNGEAIAVLGTLSLNSENELYDFTFKTDWRTIKSIANSERTDFITQDGQSQLAILDVAASLRDDTKTSIGRANFDDAQVQLYYFCNPK
jgi:hypothetical protein